MSVSLITLNFQDYEGCKRVYEQAVKIEAIDHIIIIDNSSKDGSFERLQNELQGREKLEIVQTGRNGGYSAGYNFGFKYSQKYFSEYVFLCNSDVIISKKLIEECLKFLKENPLCGATSGRMINSSGKELVSAWNFPRYRDDILYCFWGLRKYILPRIKNNVPLKGTSQIVDSLAGSFTCYRFQALKDANFYDENVFLYNEENIIAKKMLGCGYYSVRLNNVSYIHAHHRKKPTKVNFKYLVKRNMSGLYYHSFYGKVGKAKTFLYRICIYYYSIEEWLIGLIKSFIQNE